MLVCVSVVCLGVFVLIVKICVCLVEFVVLI